MLQLIDISFNAAPPPPSSYSHPLQPTHPPHSVLFPFLVASWLFCLWHGWCQFLFLRGCGSVVCEAAVTPLFRSFTITSRPNIFLSQTQVGVKEGHLAKTSRPPSLSSFPHTQQFPLMPHNRELFIYFHQLNTLEAVPQMYIKKHTPWLAHRIVIKNSVYAGEGLFIMIQFLEVCAWSLFISKEDKPAGALLLSQLQVWMVEVHNGIDSVLWKVIICP